MVPINRAVKDGYIYGKAWGGLVVNYGGKELVHADLTYIQQGSGGNVTTIRVYR